jgi:hypothetical protein
MASKAKPRARLLAGQEEQLSGRGTSSGSEDPLGLTFFLFSPFQPMLEDQLLSFLSTIKSQKRI